MAGPDSVHESRSAVTAAQRLVGLDAHRGLIMVFMAIDHASYFIARVHSAEFWGIALPAYPSALWFCTRWITHLCAPGFFFLMGIGIVLFADARRQAGWEEGRITRFFVIRGLLLILLQLFVEDPAWILGSLSMDPGVMVIRGGIPGGGTGSVIYLGVLFALGGAMIFWGFLRRIPYWLIGFISFAAVWVTQSVMPGPDHAATLYSPLSRLLIVPGRTDIWLIFYPVVPWLGASGLGLLFGGLMKRDTHRATRLAGWTGLGFLVLFVIVRIIGAFGNLNEVPQGWIG
ncbi:MAG TPA: heparan-alpha-glucosaminide N-acetyltransferase domain-containing protein, partial [Saprospiraceae bacterium]|nr:heparan-alpha-glucosaminide N-acetyltransferase domain-containing protein [Saprospiraceae bacterium]